MAFIYDMVDTWNAIGTTFNGIKMNISNGAGGAPVGAAASRAFLLQSNATDIFSIDINGTVRQALAANSSGLISTGYSLTGSDTTAMINLAGTWNTTGHADAILLNITRTAAGNQSDLMDLQVGGVSHFRLRSPGASEITMLVSGGGANNLTYSSSTGALSGSNLSFSSAAFSTQFDNAFFKLASATLFGFTSGTSAGAHDTILVRDAANIFAQRNGTTAQAFRIYNTFTNASNYERGGLTWATNVLQIGAAAAGTGTQQATTLFGASVNLAFGATPTTAWTISSSGHFLAGTDNTYDIGASGATRPANIFIAGYFKDGVRTIASLPTAASAGNGAHMFVTDALAPAFGVTVASGGSVSVPVYSNGTNWLVG